MAFSLHPLRENMNAPGKIAAIHGYSRRKPFVTRGNFLHFHIRMRIQQPCEDLFVLLYRKRTGRVQQLSALCSRIDTTGQLTAAKMGRPSQRFVTILSILSEVESLPALFFL